MSDYVVDHRGPSRVSRLSGTAFRPAAFSGEGARAVNRSLSAVCAYAGSSNLYWLRARLGRRGYGKRIKLRQGDWVSVSWGRRPVDFVYFEWTDKAGVAPAEYDIELLGRNGAVVETRAGDRFWNCGAAVSSGVSGLRIRARGEAFLCTLIPYSGGAPKDYHPWEPTPDKTDYLLVATHPDDDTLFMGAVIPTYGVGRGLTGAVLYMTTRDRVRRTEALNGAWMMGLRKYPMMAGMRDVMSKKRGERGRVFELEDVERVIVRSIRRVRPEVVVSHDLKGEYGHWQHVVVAEAVTLAVRDAADPDYDPESAKESGVWQVKKLYLHLSDTNPIFIRATLPMRAFGGRTALEVAQEAYRCHRSQILGNHPCNNGGENSLERFGLVFSAVGPDSGVNDLFENIDPSSLSAFVPGKSGNDLQAEVMGAVNSPADPAGEEEASSKRSALSRVAGAAAVFLLGVPKRT